MFREGANNTNSFQPARSREPKTHHRYPKANQAFTASIMQNCELMRKALSPDPLLRVLIMTPVEVTRFVDKGAVRPCVATFEVKAYYCFRSDSTTTVTHHRSRSSLPCIIPKVLL